MAHKSDQERIEQTRNVPRFFVEHPQVSWVLLVGVLIWGWFGYKSMPQRKDPNIPVRVAVASCSWPGATAQQVEQLVTRPIEDTVAQNKWIHAGTPADFGIRSISLPGYAYVYIQLVDNVDDLKRQFSDINLKLNALDGQLPQGAGPITFQSDFGDTAALMLTVASPKADSVEIDLRSQSIQAAIRSARDKKKIKEVETREKLSAVAGDKYSYAELDDFSDLIARTLQGAPETSKVERRGVLPQTIYLEFSEDRLAAYGPQPADLGKLIQAHNIIAPGGVFETGQRQIILNPSGQFQSAKAIGDIVVTTTAAGAPVYLRDLVDISRGYQSPANYLNYYTWQGADGTWSRNRAVTIAIYMRDENQIAKFGASIDEKMAQLRRVLPSDLIIVHTSDQPLQVKENIHLFLRALNEAIILVVIVSLIGFWEWRLAVIMALAIPITLAMTFGVVYMLGI